MPYTLRNLGYETVLSDENSYSTRVTIEDEGGEDERILLRADEIGTEIPVDIGEWPLIVQAVERLLADRAAKTEAFKPAVTEEFLKSIDFHRAEAVKVIGGEVEILGGAFTWAFTKQNHEYWYDRQRGVEKLSSSDKALLQSWVDAADYYEKNND